MQPDLEQTTTGTPVSVMDSKTIQIQASRVDVVSDLCTPPLNSIEFCAAKKRRHHFDDGRG